MRVRIAGLKHDTRRAAEVCDALRSVRGVRTARANVVTGSVTLTYDHRRVTSASLRQRLATVIGPLRAEPTLASPPATEAMLIDATQVVVEAVLKNALEAVVRRAILSMI